MLASLFGVVPLYVTSVSGVDFLHSSSSVDLLVRYTVFFFVCFFLISLGGKAAFVTS